MANIPLQSISFPGLSDKYTTPVVDNTLAVAGAAADAKKTGDEIGAIKNDLSDGTFIVNNAENAEQLTSTVGIEDTAPYLFRTSGGSNDIGDREDVRKIVGGTIVNNQNCDFGSFINTATDTKTPLQLMIQAGTPYVTWLLENITSVGVFSTIITSSQNLTGFRFKHNGSQQDLVFGTNSSYEIVSGHKYFASINFKGVDPTTLGGVSADDIMFTDLTQELGATIADYVYNLETATAGAGVAWLKKHFPKQFDAGYQAYDAGSLQSVSGLTEHRMVGFNQWDEETEIGDIDGITGAFKTGNYLRTKNYIPVLPNTTYYFNIPSAVFYYEYDANKNVIMNGNYAYHSKSTSGTFTTGANTHFITFRNSIDNASQTYNHDICINLHWDGEKDGTYEPYKEYTYPLDSSLTLRGIPKLDSNNQLYYDGDEYLPDGTVNRRYGVVDLGTLNWGVKDHATFGKYFYGDITSLVVKFSGSFISIPTNAISPKYINTVRSASLFIDKSMCFDGNSGVGQVVQIQIKDSAYTDVALFKASLSGVYLLYEKATPTTKTALSYQETQIVDDFGTEEFVLADGAFPVPVGHNTMYQNNLRAKLEMSPDSPDGDGLYVVQQESGENTYVPLASTATIQDILTRLTALENA